MSEQLAEKLGKFDEVDQIIIQFDSLNEKVKKFIKESERKVLRLESIKAEKTDFNKMKLQIAELRTASQSTATLPADGAPVMDAYDRIERKVPLQPIMTYDRSPTSLSKAMGKAEFRSGSVVELSAKTLTDGLYTNHTNKGIKGNRYSNNYISENEPRTNRTFYENKMPQIIASKSY